MAAEASAPGKVILFGEHSVVYRGPAVVLAIDKRAHVVAERRSDEKIFFDAENLGYSGYFSGDTYYPERGAPWRGKNLLALKTTACRTMERLGTETGLSLTIRSEIPVAVGLGSSAAVCVATVAAVSELLGGGLPQEEVCSLAFEGEKVIHGAPSGVDNNISTYGGVLRYEKGVGFERLKVDERLPFVIGNSRRKRSTRRLVEMVRDLRERNTDVVDGIIDGLCRVSREGLSALLESDMRRMGDLMNIGHGLLSALGVSSPELDIMVHAARRAGAIGAKLTGAGGGGCILALTEDDSLKRVEGEILREGGEPLRVNVSHQGVTSRRLG